jgi:predicted O-linked N-acetylglucosamine transferase (SPINDLY family)
MLVNFHIIKAENDMQKRDYASKNASVNFINNNYKKFDLSDYDYLSLAQFFSFYANTDLAVELLETKSRSIDIDEDLLFYYLNLTIIDKNLTENANYRTVLLNAFNMNSERFCKLFNSIENGGVTFQLLSDEYLRTTYCESCEQ